MNFKEYQDETAVMPLYDNLLYGLIGEVGEVAELIKKNDRQGAKRQVMSKERIEEELSDVLWYLSRLYTFYGLSMDDGAKSNIKKLKKRHGVD